jgi:hypothetical protein
MDSVLTWKGEEATSQWLKPKFRCVNISHERTIGVLAGVRVEGLGVYMISFGLKLDGETHYISRHKLS